MSEQKPHPQPHTSATKTLAPLGSVQQSLEKMFKGKAGSIPVKPSAQFEARIAGASESDIVHSSLELTIDRASKVVMMRMKIIMKMRMILMMMGMRMRMRMKSIRQASEADQPSLHLIYQQFTGFCNFRSFCQ